MASWDELFQAAAAEAGHVDDFYACYGDVPEPEKVQPKGRRPRKGVEERAEEETETVEKTEIVEVKEEEGEMMEIPMQKGDAFAELCFKAVLEHDRQERRQRRARRWWKDRKE